MTKITTIVFIFVCCLGGSFVVSKVMDMLVEEKIIDQLDVIVMRLCLSFFVLGASIMAWFLK
jgi:hypothetical protein